MTWHPSPSECNYLTMTLPFAQIFINVMTNWPGSVVGIVADHGLDGPGIESRWGRDFPHLSRPSLGPTQPPVQWAPGLSGGYSSRGVTLTPHPFLCRGQERVEQYLYSPYVPYGLYRASVSVQGCTLPYMHTYIQTYICTYYDERVNLPLSLVIRKNQQPDSKREWFVLFIKWRFGD
jgi:hypothetical protein